MSEEFTGPRIGVVGAGTRGRLFADVLVQQDERLLAGFAETNEQTAEATRSTYKCPVFESHGKLFDEVPLDAVFVTTPDQDHRVPVIAAAERGYHVLVEKPLATTAEDARAMSKAINDSGIKCMVAFENRWAAAYAEVRRRVVAGELGDVLSQTVRLSNTVAVPLRHLYWSARTDASWFLMSHTLDLVHWFANHPCDHVYATGVKRELPRRGVPTWDIIQANAYLRDGSTASLESAWILPEGHPNLVDSYHQLLGTRGAIFVDGSSYGIRLSTEDRSEFPRLRADITRRMILDFVDYIKGGEATASLDLPGLRDGVNVTLALCAIHSSLETREPVRIADVAKAAGFDSGDYPSDGTSEAGAQQNGTGS